MQIKKLFFLLLLFATYIHASFLYSNEKLNSRERLLQQNCCHREIRR